MKHVKQGDHECVLATIAILAGVSMELARETAKEQYEKHFNIPYGGWREISEGLYPVELTHQYIADIAKSLGINLKPMLRLQPSPFALALIHGIPIPKNIQNNMCDTPNLHGKGQLLIFNECCGHSVAYCNNKIYDPAMDAPCGWHDFRAQHPLFRCFMVNPIISTKRFRLFYSMVDSIQSVMYNIIQSLLGILKYAKSR